MYRSGSLFNPEFFLGGPRPRKSSSKIDGGVDNSMFGGVQQNPLFDGGDTDDGYLDVGTTTPLYTAQNPRDMAMGDVKGWSVEDVGAAVTVDGYDGAGVLVFVGRNADGKARCGVEFDEPIGNNDGRVKEHRYFSCTNKHGALVKPSIVHIAEEDDGYDASAVMAGVSFGVAVKVLVAARRFMHVVKRRRAREAREAAAAVAAAAKQRATDAAVQGAASRFKGMVSNESRGWRKSGDTQTQNRNQRPKKEAARAGLVKQVVRHKPSFKVAKAFGMAGMSKLSARDGGGMNDVQKDEEGLYDLVVPLRKAARRPSHEEPSSSRAGDGSSDDEFGQVSMTFG